MAGMSKCRKPFDRIRPGTQVLSHLAGGDGAGAGGVGDGDGGPGDGDGGLDGDGE